MSLDRLRASRHRTVGTKQTLKAVLRGQARRVYVARDAEEHVVRDLIRACEAKGIDIEYVDTMAELGSACRIKVGAASAAILEE